MGGRRGGRGEEAGALNSPSPEIKHAASSVRSARHECWLAACENFTKKRRRIRNAHTATAFLLRLARQKSRAAHGAATASTISQWGRMSSQSFFGRPVSSRIRSSWIV